ncbi:MAG: hypothetical protein QG639_75 [Patescibacteria group bacterium]|nr:hypothetical protein [Patescibacteria group bacterium]
MLRCSLLTIVIKVNVGYVYKAVGYLIKLPRSKKNRKVPQDVKSGDFSCRT